MDKKNDNWNDTRNNIEKAIHDTSKKLDGLGIIELMQATDCMERLVIVTERLYLLYDEKP